MRVQRVVMPVTGAESWTVVDGEWAPVPHCGDVEAAAVEIGPVAAERYLAHLAGITRPRRPRLVA